MNVNGSALFKLSLTPCSVQSVQMTNLKETVQGHAGMRFHHNLVPLALQDALCLYVAYKCMAECNGLMGRGYGKGQLCWALACSRAITGLKIKKV